MYVLCMSWVEKKDGSFPKKTKKEQREEFRLGDTFETTDEVINHLREKMGEKCFGTAKYPDEAIVEESFFDPENPEKSFVKYKLAKVYVPGYEHSESMGPGVALVTRSLPKVIGETEILYYIVKVEDDQELLQDRKEMMDLISDVVSERGFFTKTFSETTGEALIAITEEPDRECRCQHNSISLYRVNGQVCIRLELGWRKVPLCQTSKTNDSVTWYENLPQKHTNYLYSEENKKKIVDILKKRLKK